MKYLCNCMYTFINNIICIIIDLLCKVINPVLGFDYWKFFKEINNILKRGDNMSLELIGFEVTLITIYFIFLPFIIQDKNKEVYLGHNVSKWILYGRNKKNKFSKIILKLIKKDEIYSDICLAFIYNIFLIIISVILYILKWNLIIIILFFIFIIYLTRKVVDYLSLTSSNICDIEIEQIFLELCKKDNEKICTMLNDNKTDIINDNRKTLKFILKNYDFENMQRVYDTFYKELFNRNNEECTYMIFSEISREIYHRKENGQCVDFHIQPWDLNTFLINNMNESNVEEIGFILNTIINNSIELAMNDNKNYNEILAISYSGILKNNNIKEETKLRMLNIILDNIKYNIYISYYKDNEFIRYKYIFNLFKYFIDARDKYGLEFMMNNLKDNINYRENLYSNVLITIMIYLYYLIKIENPPFVEKKEKDYLNSIYIRVKNVVSNSGIKYYHYNNDVDVLFDWIREISHFWERFDFKNGSSSCVKTPMADNAIVISRRALYILFKRDAINNVKVNDNDLNAFSFTIENENLKEVVLKEIKDFIEFMGLSLEESMITGYINELLEYASLNAKKSKKENKSIEYFIDNFKFKEEELYSKMKKLEIFNANNLKNSQTFHISFTSDKKMLDNCIKNDFFKWVQLDNIIERKVLDIFSEKKLNSVSYSYNSERNILKKLKELKKPYYYIRPSSDNLGAEYKFGQEYLRCISKFKIINTTVAKKRFIIDNYRCELKNIEFEVRELKEEELKSFIKKYKRGKDYYVKDSYGFEIKYSKNEIIDYCKNKYAFCILTYELGIDIENSKGYKFVYKKRSV